MSKLRETEVMLIGDVLLASAFVSYIGAFSNTYRRKLWQDTWIPDLKVHHPYWIRYLYGLMTIGACEGSRNPPVGRCRPSFDAH